MDKINNQSVCININTGQTTTNKSNTKFHGTEEELQQLNKAHLRTLSFNEEHEKMLANLKNGMFANPNIGNITKLDEKMNSLVIGKGQSFTLDNGFTVSMNANGKFEISGNPSDDEGMIKAHGVAGALNLLIKYSTKQVSEHALFLDGDEKRKWTQSALEGLSHLGIDVSKDFILNGMKFSLNGGILESQEYSEAQEAYEKQQIMNKTYSGADEKTKIIMDHRQGYYFRNSTEEVIEAWERALEESNSNPFADGISNTLAQITVEQDYATGGNDDVFGSTVESAINAAERLLERSENPLGVVDQEYNVNEQEFYRIFLNNLNGISNYSDSV